MQFGLDFLVVQIHYRQFQPAQFVAKSQFVPSRQLRRLAERQLPDLEQPKGQLKLQILFDLVPRFTTHQQQIIRLKLTRA
jgi:hypothetical protein